MYFYKVKCLFFTNLGGLNGLKKPKSRSVINVLFMLLFSVSTVQWRVVIFCINGPLF